ASFDGGGDFRLERTGVSDTVVYARRTGDERVQVVHREVVDLARTDGTAIHHRESEGRQGKSFLVDAVTLGLIARFRGFAGREPTARTHLLEQLCRGGEVAAIAVQGLEGARLDFGQARKAIVALQQ